MTQSKSDFVKLVLDSLREMDPKDSLDSATEASKPIGDLGFDSYDGIEYAVYLSVILPVRIPDDVNPFRDDSGKHPRARSIGEIASYLMELTNRSE